MYNNRHLDNTELIGNVIQYFYINLSTISNINKNNQVHIISSTELDGAKGNQAEITPNYTKHTNKMQIT